MSIVSLWMHNIDYEVDILVHKLLGFPSVNYSSSVIVGTTKTMIKMY